VEEEKKQHTGCLRPQTFEEPPKDFESLLASKFDDPLKKREQLATDLRRNKRQEIVSKKRWDLVLSQLQREKVQHSELALSHLPE
jgi:hypothetical protein